MKYGRDGMQSSLVEVQCKLDAVHHSRPRVLKEASVDVVDGALSRPPMFVLTLVVKLNPEVQALSWPLWTGRSTEVAGLSTSSWDS